MSGPKKRQIYKADLEAQLDTNPYVTHKELGVTFQCSDKIIARELRRNGLSTKSWLERTHTAATKAKISASRVEQGLAKGPRNPNYGAKKRPWLEGENHPLRQWHKSNPQFGDGQKGLSNPIHKVRHLYADPSYVERITSGIRAHAEAKRGSSYEALYGETKAKEYKERLRAASPVRLAKFARKVTGPELIVREMLGSLGVTYNEQYAIGYYTVDFYVPSKKLVIQVDGDYWHANPKMYSDHDLSKNQQKQKRLDSSCSSFLLNRGYQLIRLWEDDLYNRHEGCLRQLQTVLAKDERSDE